MKFLPFSPQLPLMAAEFGIPETGIESHTENSAASASPSSAAGCLVFFMVRADQIYVGDQYEC